MSSTSSENNENENENTPAASPSPDNKKKLNETIVIKVADPNGGILSFKVKMVAPLVKLMNAYCDKQKMDKNAVRFFFDGQRINDTDTPSKLSMENQDVIECYAQQTGG